MKILNLYAGIGGNRKLWGNEHEVTAVELNPEIAAVYAELFPKDKVVVGDAHQYLLDHYEEYDFIWSSPPCPTHSKMSTVSVARGRRQYPDMALYQEILWLKHFFKGIWVVENVKSFYTPLIQPEAVVDRHFIWSNKPIRDQKFTRIYFGSVTDQTIGSLSAAYGIRLPVNTKNKRKLLRNAVFPPMGQYVLNQVTSNGKN